MIKPLNIILVCFLVTACSIERGVRTPSGYIISNSKKFSLKDRSISPDTESVALNRLYVFNCATSMAGLEFYPGGRVAFVNNIKLNDNKSVTFLRAGYYYTDKDSIVMEISTGVSLGMVSGDQWGFLLVKGKIDGDTLKFYSDQWHGKGKNTGEFLYYRENGKNCFFTKSGSPTGLLNADW